jgi:hypothetical protein
MRFISLSCKFCKTTYQVKPYREKISSYCSRKCSATARLSVPEVNQKKGHKRENNCNWKGGRSFTEHGYIEILLPDHPQANKRGYVREHRYVMEQFLGRYLEKWEHVHHKNQDKTDNDIKNLELLDIAEHTRLHNAKRKYHKGVHYSPKTEFKNGHIPWNKGAKPS